MWDLRWVLLGLGALVLIAVYLWSRGIVSRDMLPTLPRRKERTEPRIGGEPPRPRSLRRSSKLFPRKKKRAPGRTESLRYVWSHAAPSCLRSAPLPRFAAPGSSMGDMRSFIGNSERTAKASASRVSRSPGHSISSTSATPRSRVSVSFSCCPAKAIPLRASMRWSKRRGGCPSSSPPTCSTNAVARGAASASDT